MRPLGILLFLACALGLGLPGCALSQRDVSVIAAASARCEVCAQAKTGGTIWCKNCDTGYVDGKKTQSCCDYTQLTGGNQCTICNGAGQ